MTPRKALINPLVAARLRPYRRPPTTGVQRQNGPILRISHSSQQKSGGPVSITSENCRDVLTQVQQIASALTIAQETIDLILQHLVKISEITRVGDRYGHPDNAHQSPINETAMAPSIQAIDDLVHSATFQGAPLLNGTWSITIADPAAKGIRTLRIPSLTSRDLGNKQFGDSVASLAEGSSTGSSSHAIPDRQSIARQAILQTATAREQVGIFLRDAVEPLMKTMEVSTANQEAAQRAVEDDDFAGHVSQLTLIDALIQAGPCDTSAQESKTFSLISATADKTDSTHPSDNHPTP